MGSKGTTTQTGQQSYVANPAVAQAGQQAIGMAQQATSQPFSLPVQQYAGFTPQQQMGFGQTAQYAQSGQPYFGLAGNYMANAGQPISQNQINQYLNPYASNVMANLSELQGQQMADVTGKLTQTAGGVGADRIAVGQSELARQQNLAQGQTLAGIYGQALSAAQQQQQAQLAAGYGLGNLGATAQTAGLQGAQANYGMGLQQQQLAQNQMNAQYSNILAQLAYPYQNTQFLAGITGGLAGALGGTTAGAQYTTPPPPNPYSQIAGLGIGAAGLAGAYNSFQTPSATGATGGRVGYQSGGNVDSDNSSDYSNNVLSNMGDTGTQPTQKEGDEEQRMGDLSGQTTKSPIPGLQVQSPNMMKGMQFSSPQQQQGIGLGDIAKTAAAILPLFALQTGGRTGYADGGGAGGTNPFGPGMPYGAAAGSPFGAGTSFIPSMQVASQANHPALNFGNPNTKPQGMSTKDLMSGVQTIGKLYKDNRQKQDDYAQDAQQDAEEGGSGADYGWAEGGDALGGRIDQASPYQAFQEGGDVSDFGSRWDAVIKPDDPRRALGLGLMRQGVGYQLGDAPGLVSQRASDREAMEDANRQRGLNLLRQGQPAGPQGPQLVSSQLATKSDPTLAAQVPKRIPVTGGVDYAQPPASPQGRQVPPAPTRPPDEDQPFKPTPVDVSRIEQFHGVPYPNLNSERDVSRRLAMNPWLALANAGFGMAAGTSPYALTNVGAGAQQGIKTLQEQRKELATEEGINARARQLGMDAEKLRLNYTQMTPYQQSQIDIQRQQLEQQGWQKSEFLDGTIAYTKPGSEEGIKFSPDGTVTRFRPGESFPGTGAPQSPQSVPGPPNVPTASPTEPAPMGVEELRSHNEVAPRPTPMLPKSQQTIINHQTDLIDKEIAKKGYNLSELQNNLMSMKQAYATLMADRDKDGFLTQLLTTPGAAMFNGMGLGNHQDTVEGRLERAREINTIAEQGGKAPVINPRKLAAAEEMAKIQKRMGATFAGQISARPAFQMEKIGINATPGMSNSPAGFLALMPSFDAARMNTEDQIQHWANWQAHPGNRLSPSQWRAEFMRTHTPDYYFVRSTLENIPSAKLRDHLPQAIALLRKEPTRENIEQFNKFYHGTASYFLTGKMSPYEAGTP
jgi:hypothetical protein